MSAAACTSPLGAVDLDELRLQMRVVSHFLSAHGGSIEIESIGEDGVVHVRFEGLCTSCALRPLSLETLVRPALLEVAGVTGVEAAGLRISAKAGARLAAISAAEREAAHG
jgi:Fe-S cluster biogenesis protein NfuA